MGITISKATGKLPIVTRASVPVNSLFRHTKDGKATGAIFANLGYGDKLRRYYSVALDGDKKGALSGASTGSKPVAIVGSFVIEAKLGSTSTHKVVSRGSVAPGDVFQVPNSRASKTSGKPAMFMHLGDVDSGSKLLSWNLNSRKLAIGTKLNGKVKKVGDVAVQVDLAA